MCIRDSTYPIHKYAPVIAGADVRSVPIGPGRDFFEDLEAATRQAWPKPKLLFLCYPHNPTTEVTDLAFFEKIVEFAKENNIWVIHDLASVSYTHLLPATIGPTVCELDGPMPILNRSKTLSMRPPRAISH